MKLSELEEKLKDLKRRRVTNFDPEIRIGIYGGDTECVDDVYLSEDGYLVIY